MHRQSKRTAAKRMLLWSIGAFVTMQVALNAYMESKHAAVYDPEYRDRVTLLRERVAEAPDRPLLLMVGSSRFMTGIAPEVLPPLDSVDGAPPLPFNFAHSGAGALHNLVAVRRLLREGFEPKWLVIEMVPYLLPAAQRSTLAKLALAEDLLVLRRYIGPAKLYGWYAWERATACVHHRGAFIRALTPTMQHPRWDVLSLEPLGGKTPTDPIPDAQEKERQRAVVRGNYQPALQNFRIHQTSRQAMHELLEVCRERNIRVAIMLTPECSDFRSWYSSDAQEQLKGFCAELRNQHGVPIIDARAWLDDEDFSDGHHVLPGSAKRLTLRVGAEVLSPLIRGELHFPSFPTARLNRVP